MKKSVSISAIVIISGLVLYGCRNPGSVSLSVDKPNVLFISVDDLNDWSGCLGNYPHVSTPHIDGLATRGIIFKNAHCQAPICAPSRASVYTGINPHSTGIYYQLHDKEIRLSSGIAAEAVYLPDFFEKSGYKSFGVGKLFHDGDAAGVYDVYGGIFPEMGFGPKPDERIHYDPRWFSETRGTATDWGPLDMDDSEMSDYKIAEWAIEILDQDHEAPFFLSVGFIRPHVPWHVPLKWYEMFPVEEMILPPYRPDDLDDVPEISRRIHEMPAMPDTEWLIKENLWGSMIQSYLACMAFMDHQVGKVLRALEKSKYADNTVIVLWSDHGYHLGEKGRTCKHSLWYRSTHIPLIFAGPGISPGTSSDAQVGLIDMYPTLTELCGLEDNDANEGHSLVPLIRDPRLEWEHPVYTSYGYKNISIYREKYHYIHYSNGEAELYDLEQDPNEWENLANHPEFKEVIEEFDAQLPAENAAVSPYSIMRVNDYVDSLLSAYKAAGPLQ